MKYDVFRYLLSNCTPASILCIVDDLYIVLAASDVNLATAISIAMHYSVLLPSSY
jgi:hypothetical protein